MKLINNQINKIFKMRLECRNLIRTTLINIHYYQQLLQQKMHKLITNNFKRIGKKEKIK